jgi:hypothetical protein
VRGIINCALKVRALLYITVQWATVDRKGNHTVNYTLLCGKILMKKQLSLNIAIHYLTDKKVKNLMVTSIFGFDGAEYKKTINVGSNSYM